MVNALVEAAQQLNRKYHVGLSTARIPITASMSQRLCRRGMAFNKWEAWKKGGALTSEMESSTLFIVGSYLRARVGSVLLVCGNQEREKANMDNPKSFDTDLAIQVAIQAVRNLIKKDREKST